jgi:BirA family biotin operon repressor/biotin-[acetyl-CoA-carboxylase] ligase
MPVSDSDLDRNPTRRAIATRLATADEPVAGPDLAAALDISRAAVWKQIEALRDAGFGIASDDAGYRLTDVPEFGGAAIECGLDAPFAVEAHASIGSTNDRARELAAAGADDAVVVADEQTGGRGRLDREWSSPSGGAWTSVVLRPSLPPAETPLFTLAAAVAVVEAAAEAGVEAGIKWPNDVIVPDSVRDASDGTGRGGHKLAGVLTEMEGETDRVDWVVVGIGLNANVPAEALPDDATSLAIECGEPAVRRDVVRSVLERLHSFRSAPETVVPAWREHALTLGERVRVETPRKEIVGEAVDIERDGTLVVRNEQREERVRAGDCEHLRPT